MGLRNGLYIILSCVAQTVCMLFRGMISSAECLQCLAELQNPMLNEDGTTEKSSPNFKAMHKHWRILVTLSILFVFIGQTAAFLLGRLYYAESGSSIFLGTLIQTAGFPILYIPLILIPSNQQSLTISTSKYMSLIYIGLGILLAASNLLFSVGLLYLSASTDSIITSTQLAFTAVFSYFLNSQKFNALIINSVVFVTLSAVLLAVGDNSDQLNGVSRSEYIIGVLSTVSSAAATALLLSLMQLTFEKVIKSETFAAVIKMQIYTSLVATVLSMAGIFLSGEWTTLRSDMENFDTGPASYVMTLFWSGLSWQMAFIGMVGLIFLVSSLFSNVITTAALAATPIAALIVFHDPMSGVKCLAMVFALWGFATYLFQNYLDHRAEIPDVPSDDSESLL